MVELSFKKKSPDEVKEDVFLDKDPKRLLEKVKKFEETVLKGEKEESRQRKEELSVDFSESPILSELKEQYDKGMISSKSYEEVMEAFRTLKTPKLLVNKNKGEEMAEEESGKTNEPAEEPVKEEAPAEKPENEEESPEGGEKKSEEEKKEPAKKKDDVDENYEGLGALNALKKLLGNIYRKNQKEKAYWSRAGNFYFPLDDLLSEINGVLSEVGLMSIELGTLKNYLEKLGFVDGTSIVDTPVKTPDMEKEESRTIIEFTPQALEKINSPEELEEPDQKGKKQGAAQPQALQEPQIVSAPQVPVGMPSEKLVEFEKAFEELRTKSEAFDERVKDLNEKLSELSERLAEVKGQISAREKNFGEMQLRVETLTTQMGEINPQVMAKVQRETANRLDGFDNSFKEIGNTITDLLTRFEKISETFKDLRNLKLLIEVGKDVGEKLVKIEAAEAIMNRLSNKVEDMYLQVEKKFSDLPVFVDKVNRIDGLSFELLQAMDSLRTRMADYVSKTDLGEYKAQLENKFSRLEDEIDLVSDKPLVDSDREYFAQVLEIINGKKDDLKHQTRILNEQFDDALISQKTYNELRRIKDDKKRSVDELEGRIISVLDRGRTDKHDLESLYKQCKELTGRTVKPVEVGEKPAEAVPEIESEPVKEVRPEVKTPEPVKVPEPVEKQAEAIKTPEKPVEKAEEAELKEAEPLEEEKKPAETPRVEESSISTEEKPSETVPEKNGETGEKNQEPVISAEEEKKEELPKTEASIKPRKVLKYITFTEQEPEKATKTGIKQEVKSKGYSGAVEEILTNLHKLRQEYEPGNKSLTELEEKPQKH